MINKKYISIILFILFAATAYLLLSNKSSFYSKNETTKVNENVTSDTQFVGSFSVVLKSGDNPSDYGIAVFAKSEDKTKVSIKMINSSNRVTQNAYIYKNTCSNLGEIKHELSGVVNGSSETTLDITTQDFITSFPMALVIGDTTDNQASSCTDIIN